MEETKPIRKGQSFGSGIGNELSQIRHLLRQKKEEISSRPLGRVSDIPVNMFRVGAGLISESFYAVDAWFFSTVDVMAAMEGLDVPRHHNKLLESTRKTKLGFVGSTLGILPYVATVGAISYELADLLLIVSR